MSDDLRQELKSLVGKIQTIIEDLPEHVPVSSGVAMEIATEARAAELTGYTVETLRGRRKSGLYAQNDVWWHDQHGKVIYDLTRLQELMRCHQQKESTPASKSGGRPSASGLSGRTKDAGKRTQPPLQLQA